MLKDEVALPVAFPAATLPVAKATTSKPQLTIVSEEIVTKIRGAIVSG